MELVSPSFSPCSNIVFPTYRSTVPPKLRPPLLVSSFSRCLRVSAHFSRPYRRRNSLREKLNDVRQVTSVPTLPPPSSDSQNPGLKFDDSKENLALDEEQGNKMKPKWADSVLLSRLENRVDHYKNDEILERDNELEEDSAQVHLKMGRGSDVIPANRSLAKFVSSIRDVVSRPQFVPVLWKVGKLVLFSLVAAWALKRLLNFEDKKGEYSQLEREMMRRKMKHRKEKEALVESEVEVVVVEGPKEKVPIGGDVERPKLDKQQLMRSIFESNDGMGKLVAANDTSALQPAEVDPRIQQIQAMARKARETERRERSVAGKVEEGSQVLDVESFAIRDSESSDELDVEESNSIQDSMILQGDDDDVLENAQGMITIEPPYSPKIEEGEGTSQVTESFSKSESSLSSELESVLPKPMVITSVKEAREFLSKRKCEDVQTSQADSLTMSRDDNGELFTFNGKQGIVSELNVKASEPFTLGGASNSLSADTFQSSSKDSEDFISKEDHSKVSADEVGMVEAEMGSDFLTDIDNGGDRSLGGKLPKEMPKWLEEHSNELEPIFKKIGDGFKDNFKIARETVSENSNISLDSLKLEFQGDDGEVDWMNDECLRDIVFRVRDNELCGRDPFHLIEAEDKRKFFEGLEKKVERENEKLRKVHEYLHANIENLDYGADGISLYDRPEKFIPLWKGPSIERNPEFLDNVIQQRQRDSTKDNKLHKDEESKLANGANLSSANHVLRKHINKKDPKVSKVVIEGSDGSARPGKKTGKEFWQHTKKWSRGFVDSYSAETDPEVKSAMKDIGKDLDKWITEEEIQEAADMMTKLPDRKKEFLEKKISKLKREMELFGPQAVVSKYREYAEEKEEDFLWWLDLPHVLCIELYTTENGEQRTGFYSLEMAADLELEPKPYHVIAFEDLHDCRNLCYIIQTHLEMLGAGHAFVVPRPPKDAFREAKANGFSVTVIRKGQLQMDIDQPLEEVEEEITEIGSKIYHDKLVKERSVDMHSLMKGVLGIDDQTAKTLRKRAKKRKANKPTGK